MLSLPDFRFTKVYDNSGVNPRPLFARLKNSVDFGSEIGLSLNASISMPVSDDTTISFKGFWSEIDDDGVVTCPSSGDNECFFAPLVDDPTADQVLGTGGIRTTSRDVNHWGLY